MKLSGNVTINKPIQHAWDCIIDPANLPKWIIGLEKYERLTGNPSKPRPGDTGRHTYNQSGRKFVMEEQIVDCEEPYRIKILLTSGLFDMEVVNTLETVDHNQTKLVASAEFVRRSFFMKAVMLFSRLSKQQAVHEAQLQKLKGLVEAA